MNTFSHTSMYAGLPWAERQIFGGRWLAAGALAIALIGAAPVAMGTDYSFAGPVIPSNTWKDWTDAIWTPAGYPNAVADSATINFKNNASNSGIDIDANIEVGTLLVGYSYGAAAVGEIRFRSTTGKTLSIGNSSTDGYLAVGSAEAGFAGQGTLNLAGTSTVNLYGGQLNVGATDPNSVTDNGTLTGVMTISNGATLNVGTATQRSEWNIGHTIFRNGNKMEGTVTAAAGANVNAYLSTLRIAVAPSNPKFGGISAPASGTLDLSDATVSTFDVSGNVEIGRGRRSTNSNAPLVGTLAMGSTDVAIGGDFNIGDDASYLGTSGTANFDGTRVTVAGGMLIDATGTVNVTIDGTSAGVQLGLSSTLTINSIDGYVMTFEEPLNLDTLYYGLSWEGNHLSALQNLVTGSAISWVNNTSYDIDVFYNGASNLTYIGVIPEPSPALLLLGGMMVGMLLYQRRSAR